ncbi:MAG: hypothetical protein RIT10_313 [Bacteroidota bacterium]|jgi:uncharacterized membrane protein
MNGAHLHLVVNHLPIITPIIGVLILVIGLILKSELVKRIAYGLFVLTSITTFMSMSTGEGAEEIAEGIAGVTHNTIHEHEEQAEVFALLAYILGGLSVFALWLCWKRKAIAKMASYTVFFIAVLVIYQGRKAGTTGGEIRHTEIRADYKAPIQVEDED